MFAGNGLGTVLMAYAIQKLKKLGTIDILVSPKHPFIEEKIMGKFFGRLYSPPEFCLQNKSVHVALRTKTILFPLYKSKLEYQCECALEKFLMFEKLKKNTIPYFTIRDEANYCTEEEHDSVKITAADLNKAEPADPPASQIIS